VSEPTDDDRTHLVTTRCRHFWRQRNPIPTVMVGGPGGKFARVFQFGLPLRT
jgi:hypothetical protein